MNKIFIPPIKCQGIKTKLIDVIKHISSHVKYEMWIEPFMGTGVVGFNIRPEKAIFADSNPHLIRFYSDLQMNKITPQKVKSFLQSEGNKLLIAGEDYYYKVRERFNNNHDPLDFLFLNRSCFNGMIRFNSKGDFNVPFCRKPNRFSKAYITKIVNQIENIQEIIKHKKYSFVCQSFDETIKQATKDDLIYCDPPYIGRHVDYFDSWNEKQEFLLHKMLTESGSKFILSTWHSNKYRKNEYLNTLWTNFHISTIEHFYHLGGKEDNRNPILEAVITNFPAKLPEKMNKTILQGNLFDLIENSPLHC
ncbi:MAG: Dam family site-specific DNA-(adenine-N6)-methyltransferase [Bacteroidota bacterium]